VAETTSAPTVAGPRRAIDIPVLTGVRLFPALIVPACHFTPLSGSFFAPGRLLEAGEIAVQVFFVLSGFVIAHTYAHKLATPARGAMRSYVVARLARMYPLHLVTFLLMALIVGAGALQGFDVDAAITADVKHSVFTFVGNLLALQALPGIPAWNFPAWSVTCELAAYLLFPLFAARLLRARPATAVVLALLVLGAQIAALDALSSAPYYVVCWVRIAGGFVAGALLWVVWHRALRPGRWGDVVVVACVLASAGLIWLGHALLPFVLVAVMIPAAASATGPVARLLSRPTIQWGGRTSYALYLVHVPVMAAIMLWVVPLEAYLHRWSLALVYVGVALTSVAAAAALHHGVEEPARKWVRRRWEGRKQRIAASTDTTVAAVLATPVEQAAPSGRVAP
jgi:peptidoglycan/LPS O-acetylase OafA/YrhL